MPIPFLIEKVTAAEQQQAEQQQIVRWIPADPSIRNMVSYQGPDLPYEDIRESMFMAIDGTMPGAYTLDVPVEQARSVALARVDQTSDAIISAGFTYNDIVFSLTVEAQIRYSTMLMLAANLSYPLGINSLDDHNILYLQSAQDTQQFCMGAMARVKEVVDSGTHQKDVIRSATNSVWLLSYADPRTFDELSPADPAPEDLVQPTGDGGDTSSSGDSGSTPPDTSSSDDGGSTPPASGTGSSGDGGSTPPDASSSGDDGSSGGQSGGT